MRRRRKHAYSWRGVSNHGRERQRLTPSFETPAFGGLLRMRGVRRAARILLAEDG